MLDNPNTPHTASVEILPPAKAPSLAELAQIASEAHEATGRAVGEAVRNALVAGRALIANPPRSRTSSTASFAAIQIAAQCACWWTALRIIITPRTSPRMQSLSALPATPTASMPARTSPVTFTCRMTARACSSTAPKNSTRACRNSIRGSDQLSGG